MFSLVPREAAKLMRVVLIGTLSSSAKRVCDVSDDSNQILADYNFSMIEEYLAKSLGEKAVINRCYTRSGSLIIIITTNIFAMPLLMASLVFKSQLNGNVPSPLPSFLPYLSKRGH